MACHRHGACLISVDKKVHQIIQLFGRGVRLRGKNMSLKRSAALDGEHPANISLLETLNIFAVRANFMAQFRDYLMREGIELNEPIQMEIPIISNQNFLARRLFIPDVQPYDEAAKGKCVPLTVNIAAYIIHTTQIVEVIGSSTQQGIRGSRSTAALERKIPEESLKLVDWEKIYRHLIEYKQEKQFHNLIFDVQTLKTIMEPSQELYGLTVMAGIRSQANDRWRRFTSFRGISNHTSPQVYCQILSYHSETVE